MFRPLDASEMGPVIASYRREEVVKDGYLVPPEIRRVELKEPLSFEKGSRRNTWRGDSDGLRASERRNLGLLEVAKAPQVVCGGFPVQVQRGACQADRAQPQLSTLPMVSPAARAVATSLAMVSASCSACRHWYCCRRSYSKSCAALDDGQVVTLANCAKWGKAAAGGLAPGQVVTKLRKFDILGVIKAFRRFPSR